MLGRVLSRLGRSVEVDRIVVATTTRRRDDMLAAWCRSHHHYVTRGPEDDVLQRYRDAARETGAGTIVRVTSDCPFIDPEVVDQVVAALGAHPGADYAANVIPPRTFPRGLDCEAFTRESLGRAHDEDQDPASREHVTPHMRKAGFHQVPVRLDQDLSRFRWTVDTREDLMMARAAYRHFGHDRFTWRDLMTACAAHPDWMRMNADVTQKEAP